MNIPQLLSSKFNQMKTHLSTVNAFKEYVSKSRQNITDFMSGNARYLMTMLNRYDDAGNFIEATLCVLDQFDYQASLDSDDPISCLKKSGQQVTMQFEELFDQLEESVIDLTAQETFLESVLANVKTTNVGSFLQSMATKISDVAPATLGKYSKYLSSGASPMDALKGYFTDTSEVIVDETQMQLVSDIPYTGSPWAAAWNKITDTVANFFTWTWEGIKSLGTLFSSMIDGLVNLGKWLLERLFPQLSSRYTVLNDTACGAIDYPLFQIDIGSLDEVFNEDTLGYDSEVKTNIIQLTYLGTRYTRTPYNIQFNWSALGYNQTYKRLISSATRREIDGVTIKRISEYIIPNIYCCPGIEGNDNALSIRIGVDPNNHLLISGYAIISSQYVKSNGYLSDEDVFNAVKDTLLHSLFTLELVAPSGVDDIYPSDQLDYFNRMLSQLYNFENEDKDLHQVLSTSPLFHHICTAANTSNSTDVINNFIAQLFMYCSIVNADDAFKDTPHSVTQPYNYLYVAYKTFTPTGLHQREILDSSGLSDWKEFYFSFKPYTKDNITPFKYHLQTVSEMATEIISFGVGVLIAVVGVAVAIKLHSVKRSLKTNKALVDTNVTKAANKLLDDKSPENVKAYKLAVKRQRKHNKLSRLLGVDTAASANRKDAEPTEDAQVDSFSEVFRLIRG